MPPFLDLSRRNRTSLGRWWWTLDTWILGIVILIMAIGFVTVLAASPSIAYHRGWDAFFFVKKHTIFLLIALLALLASSFLKPRYLIPLAYCLYAISLILMVLVIFTGTPIKGAKRWINFMGFSLQPSEFLKPSLAVCAGHLLTLETRLPNFPGSTVALVLCAIAGGLLLLQPDLGTCFLLLSSLVVQLYVAQGALWIKRGCVLLFSCVALAFVGLPHVKKRLLDFIMGDPQDNYQLSKALEAMSQGGLWGCGPGEGKVKNLIPDAHADFILAVAAEELGVVFCLFIIMLYIFLSTRIFMNLVSQKNIDTLFLTVGLTTTLMLQVLFNAASTLGLVPPKGIALPFISYGGSALVSFSILVGFILALNRPRSPGN